LDGSWIGVQTVKFVFKTGGQIKFEVTLKDKFDHVTVLMMSTGPLAQDQ